MSKVSKVFPRELRKYIYAVAVAFVPVAIYFRWIEPEAAPIVLPLILALLNLTPEEGQVIPDGTGRHRRAPTDA